jgi:outer membrane receptor protein involved in Fe transport
MFLAGEASAQSGTVRGRVVRADQDAGVPDAEVLVRGTTLSARSDGAGRFAIVAVPAGQVELLIRRLGFAPASLTLTLEPDGVVEVEASLSPAVTMLDPIVTSATLDPRSLASIPAGVSVADTASIGRDRTVALSETLRMMPGVQVASRYGTEDVNIGIRGSSMRTRQGVRGLAVLLDGIPITESDGAARVDLIELAAARQVEVVRGPASALYSGSSGGVVNVVSRSGADTRGIVGRGQHGSYGFGKVDVSVGDATADGRGSALAAGSYTSATGYRARSASSMSRGQLRTELRVAPRTVVAIEANGSWGESQVPGTLTQPETDADPFAASPVAVAWGFSRKDDRWRAGTGSSRASRGRLVAASSATPSTVAARWISPSRNKWWTSTSIAPRQGCAQGPFEQDRR